MFVSEREMQDTFVSLLKKRKTCGLIFEEVGNRNFFFRTDVVEYKINDKNFITNWSVFPTSSKGEEIRKSKLYYKYLPLKKKKRYF